MTATITTITPPTKKGLVKISGIIFVLINLIYFGLTSTFT
jgi:hypothetical protein